MSSISQYAKSYLKTLTTKGIHWYEDDSVKFVCLFEKPSQIKAIKPVLGPTKETRHIRNISLAGHAMRLKNFEEYDPKFKDKSWFNMVNDSDLPFMPSDYELVVKEKSTGKFKTDYHEMVLSAKRAFSEADYIIMATDPDNEGCALGMEVIYEIGAEDKVIGMVDMSKLDFFSLQEEVKHLDKIPFWNMAEAGFARSEFDWTFGINNTILASVLLGQGQVMHVGGVKSPVLRMVYDRIKHIKKFKPKRYWQFHGDALHKKTNQTFGYIVKVKEDDTIITTLQDDITSLELRLNGLDKDDPESASSINDLYTELGKLRWKLNETVREYESAERDIFSQKSKKHIESVIKSGMVMKVTNFEINKGLTQNPPLAYSLTDLQAEAGKVHHYSPAKTLQVAQKLYEGQWQSYPRTDNRYYASGEMANIKKIIPNLLGLKSFVSTNMPVPYKVKTGVFNSSKVTAHTGLAPTTKNINDTSLSGDMKIIYDMVSTRYLIQFMEKFNYYQVKLDIDVDAEVYITTHQNIEVKPGWRELYNPANMYGFNYVKKQTLPNMLIGDEIEILTIARDDLETKHKPMFSDFSLLKGMENISRIYPELEGLDKGIGTPATRASILEQLFKSKYLIKKGKIIDLSPKASTLIDLLPDDMTSPKLRADMEVEIQEIVNGNLTRSNYETQFKTLISEHYDQIKKVAKKHKIITIDKATLPPSEAQMRFALQVEKELKVSIPAKVKKLKDAMTVWLKQYEKKMPIMMSEKQYNFLKEYGSNDEKIKILIEAHEARTMTKEQKFEASKWLGSFIRTSEYQQKRAKKGAATRKKNLAAKMKKLGVKIPDVKLVRRTKKHK